MIVCYLSSLTNSLFLLFRWQKNYQPRVRQWSSTPTQRTAKSSRRSLNATTSRETANLPIIRNNLTIKNESQCYLIVFTLLRTLRLCWSVIVLKIVYVLWKMIIILVFTCAIISILKFLLQYRLYFLSTRKHKWSYWSFIFIIKETHWRHRTCIFIVAK